MRVTSWLNLTFYTIFKLWKCDYKAFEKLSTLFQFQLRSMRKPKQVRHTHVHAPRRFKKIARKFEKKTQQQIARFLKNVQIFWLRVS